MTRFSLNTLRQRPWLILSLRILWTIGTLLAVSIAQPPLLVGQWLPIVLLALIGNILLAALLVIRPNNQWRGVFNVLYDVLFIFLVLSFTQDPLLLIFAGTMAIALARIGYSQQLGLITVILVDAEALFILFRDIPAANRAHFLLAILFLLCVTLVLELFNGGSDQRDSSRVEAQRLRGARERIQSAYHMLSVTNSVAEDYQEALNSLLGYGIYDIQKTRGKIAIKGAVLLVDPSQLSGQRIYVAAGQGLNKPDESLIFSGQQGILALALRQADPIFATDLQRDPELQTLSGLVTARSVVAIPLRQRRTFGILLLASDTPEAFSDDETELFGVIGAQITATLQNMRLYQELKQEQTRLIDAEEEARKKLARDLHDGPAQSIAVIAMRLNYIRALSERDPKQVSDELYKAEDIARRTSREIRHMLFTLRPLVLETQGLTPALRQFADKMRETHNQAVIIEAAPDIDTLFSPNIQGVLFYIAEEAVGNARKHAQAAHIYVRLLHQGDHLTLEIQDDGKGFDISAMTEGYDKRGSFGMVNMRERTEMIEGRLAISSAPGKGTRITITVPLIPQPPAPETAEPPLEDNLEARLNAITPGFSASPNPNRSPAS